MALTTEQEKEYQQYVDELKNVSEQDLNKTMLLLLEKADSYVQGLKGKTQDADVNAKLESIRKISSSLRPGNETNEDAQAQSQGLKRTRLATAAVLINQENSALSKRRDTDGKWRGFITSILDFLNKITGHEIAPVKGQRVAKNMGRIFESTIQASKPNEDPGSRPDKKSR